jgi:hypothetical protein
MVQRYGTSSAPCASGIYVLHRDYAALEAECERLRAFRSFFTDRCEGLFAQFGMAAVDAYNAAGTKEKS